MSGKVKEKEKKRRIPLPKEKRQFVEIYGLYHKFLLCIKGIKRRIRRVQ